MNSIVSFTMHKIVRGVGKINEDDQNKWKRRFKSCSKHRIRSLRFEPVASHGMINHKVRCVIEFHGDADVSTAQRMANKAGLAYVKFGDFCQEAPRPSST